MLKIFGTAMQQFPRSEQVLNQFKYRILGDALTSLTISSIIQFSSEDVDEHISA